CRSSPPCPGASDRVHPLLSYLTDLRPFPARHAFCSTTIHLADDGGSQERAVLVNHRRRRLIMAPQLHAIQTRTPSAAESRSPQQRHPPKNLSSPLTHPPPPRPPP